MKKVMAVLVLALFIFGCTMQNKNTDGNVAAGPGAGETVLTDSEMPVPGSDVPDTEVVGSPMPVPGVDVDETIAEQDPEKR